MNLSNCIPELKVEIFKFLSYEELFKTIRAVNKNLFKFISGTIHLYPQLLKVYQTYVLLPDGFDVYCNKFQPNVYLRDLQLEALDNISQIEQVSIYYLKNDLFKTLGNLANYHRYLKIHVDTLTLSTSNFLKLLEFFDVVKKTISYRYLYLELFSMQNVILDYFIKNPKSLGDNNVEGYIFECGFYELHSSIGNI